MISNCDLVSNMSLKDRSCVLCKEDVYQHWAIFQTCAWEVCCKKHCRKQNICHDERDYEDMFELLD